MEATQDDIPLRFFKLLANETRLQIVGLLANQSLTIPKIAQNLAISESEVVHHIEAFEEMALVQTANGDDGHYCLHTKGLEALSHAVFAKQAKRSTSKKPTYDEKVMKAYVKNGRIRAIPMKQKKLNVLLRWLIDNFKLNRRYTEKEINEILSQFNPDYATLRRAMIEHGLMAREGGGGMYWRV